MGSRELPPDGTLSANDITVHFGGITALDGVSLTVSRGEVLGVIGPNGAGKTTLFNVICGFVPADAGTLEWRGERLERIRPERLASLGIARTLQGVGLFARLTVLENVMVGAERFRRARLGTGLLGLPGSDRNEGELRERAEAVLLRLGCEELGERLPGTLPYAVQKRVALARAGAAAARRAGGRAGRERAVRAGAVDQIAGELDRGDARRPPHGPRHLGL